MRRYRELKGWYFDLDDRRSLLVIIASDAALIAVSLPIAAASDAPMFIAFLPAVVFNLFLGGIRP